jgi:hypothetical protein
MKGRKTGGRRKGSVNKTTGVLKDAILQAAQRAGGKEGLEGYLALQAGLNPGPFMALLGKVLPLQLSGDDEHPFKMVIEWQKPEGS